MTNSDKFEFIGQIIDIFEDFLDEKGVKFSIENDIREASYNFPTIIFELTTRCCDTNEYTRYYFKNGSVKRFPGAVTVSYTPFDSIEWTNS